MSSDFVFSGIAVFTMRHFNYGKERDDSLLPAGVWTHPADPGRVYVSTWTGAGIWGHEWDCSEEQLRAGLTWNRRPTIDTGSVPIALGYWEPTALNVLDRPFLAPILTREQEKEFQLALVKANGIPALHPNSDIRGILAC